MKCTLNEKSFQITIGAEDYSLLNMIADAMADEATHKFDHGDYKKAEEMFTAACLINDNLFKEEKEGF